MALEELDGIPVATGARPARASEVASRLADAAARGAALLPVGGGTQLGVGNRARVEKLEALELGALVEPLQVDADEGIATVAAGVGVAELEHAARAVGKRTRLPRREPGASVGGTVAVDPVAPDSLPEHRLRNELLGLEVALCNGELTRCGGKVVKNVTGFDLVRLYCGSFGTLGVITELTLRLWPLPEARLFRARELPDLDAAIAAALEVLEQGVQPAGLVVSPAERGARVVWSVEGARVDAAERVARAEGEAVDEAEWDAAAARYTAPRVDPDACLVRVAARPSDTGPLARALGALGAATCAALPALGVVRARIEPDALAGLVDRARAERWALLVERAPVALKARVDVFEPLPDALPLMRELKRRFDPQGVLNPGRFVGGI